MNLNNYNKTSEVIDNKSDKISNFSSDKLPLEESKRKKNIEEEKDSIKSTENKKDDNNDNDNNDNNNNNNKICYKCNSNENETYYFSCNHLTCIECIIKDLLLNKFKKLENQKRINFNCSCHLGSIKIDREVKYKSIEFDADYISDVKKQMLNESERLIYNRTNSSDIVFKHNFSGFETSDAINLFSKSDNKVFSSFSNKVEYSYFDYSNNVLINDVQTYNVYDLLKNEFFYQNRTIFKVIFSIDNKSYNMEFSL